MQKDKREMSDEKNKIEIDFKNSDIDNTEMTAPSNSVSYADENKIEIDFKNSDIDNTEMTSTTQNVSYADNNNVGNELKDKTVSVCKMTTPSEQIAILNEKILKLQDRISTCADADEAEMMESAIDGYKNKITALYSDLQKEQKKKISAESEAKLISDFQEKDERFAKAKATEEMRQKHLIDDFVVKKKLFMFNNTFDSEYEMWADKISRKILELGVVGNRVGHNKIDERENTRLRNERLPYGIILQGKVKVDMGVADKTAKPVYKTVNIQKIGDAKYMDEEDNEYDSLNKAWAFQYRKIKDDPKSKSQGSCWALMWCLNGDGTPVLKGSTYHYLKHSKWDLLLNDYDEEYFKDKMGVANAVGANPTPPITVAEVEEAKKEEAEHIRGVLAGSAIHDKKVKFCYGGKDVEGMVKKITAKTVKVDIKNYAISKIINIEICS